MARVIAVMSKDEKGMFHLLATRPSVVAVMTRPMTALLAPIKV